MTTRDDAASRECGRWADRVRAVAGVPLTFETCTSREEADDLLRSHRNVIYFGHGERDALLIPKKLLKKARILIDRRNLAGVPARVVVAIACWSGEELGRTTTEDGGSDAVSAYLGWLDDVSWPTDWPEPVGDAVVEGLRGLLNGSTVGEAESAVKQAFDAAHDRYRGEGPGRMPTDRVAFGKMCAIYWRERIVLHGDATATL